MTTSSLRRSVKNIVNNYTDAEIKVREATSNDPWGPPSSLMAEISELTFNVVAFAEVMGIIWKRLNDHGKNWRHVYKALTLLDYLIKAGSERVAQHCRENIHAIQTLRDFQYVDREGQDQGINVREKAKQLVHLLQDGEKLKHERSQAHKTRQRMAGAGGVSGYGSMPPPYPGRRTSQPSMAAGYGGEEHVQARGSPTSHNSSTTSPHLAPDLEQARPQTVGEEELQLQLALAMSREESEKKPAPPSNVAMEMDEETQLQLALSLSKEEHQQEQQSRLGDESLLQKALEESKRDMEAKAGGSAMLDLMDIFAPAAEAPPSGSPWDLSGAGAQAQAIGPSRSDPWDSLDPSSPSRGMGSTWTSPPASLHSQPWDHRNRPADIWDAPGPVPPGQPSKPSGLGIDPFSPLSVDRKRSAALDMGSSPKPGSPTDGALYDDVMDGGRMNLNGRSEDSPELFDLSRLGQNLGEATSRTCRTPEAFLGPEGASLVNLDSLIPTNPASKNLNPFLTGLTAPSATNPFQSEAPRLTLNQLRPNSSSPAPSSLPYSASLPLPVSHQPSSLPSSFTQPAEGHANVPRTLPQPLLPLSTTAAHGPPDQSQNPFL